MRLITSSRRSAVENSVMVPLDLKPSRKYPSPGRCIYCGALPSSRKLTIEHIVPFSLGGNDEIADASCIPCAGITHKTEHHVARTMFGKFRVRTNTQTRNPKERPKTFRTALLVNGNPKEIVSTIEDHHFDLPLPIFQPPGILRGIEPSEDFGWTVISSLRFPGKRSLHAQTGAKHSDKLEIVQNWKFNPHKFGRVIAKIAYCQSIATRSGQIDYHPELVPIILGNNLCTPYLVGCVAGPPPPYDELGTTWWIKQGLATGDDGVVHHISMVRLFAFGGSDKGHGMPVYLVALGRPKFNESTSAGSSVTVSTQIS